jgi:hypothetical protein
MILSPQMVKAMRAKGRPRGTADYGGAAWPAGAEVGSQHDVGVEDGDESVEVAGAPGGKEGVDD